MSSRTGGGNLRETQTPPTGCEDGAGENPLQRFHHAHAAGLGRGTDRRSAGHLSARLFFIGEGETCVAAAAIDRTWCQRIERSHSPAVDAALREPQADAMPKHDA